MPFSLTTIPKVFGEQFDAFFDYFTNRLRLPLRHLV